MFNLINTKEQLNKIKNKLSLGVLGIVAAMIPQTAESQERQIEEVVVSATKKDESASKVAVTVTALTEETLKEMNVSNFDEYVQFLPNVSSGGRGPGQSTIYIRGMAVDPVNVFLSAAQGSTPNVALYLDEQPLQVPGRNLDVYVADMERIEVLPGPQGTLYGASSQAGTVRMITNKPKFNVQEGGFNMSHYATAHGDPSYSYDAYMNIPLINDVWSIRGVFYKSEQGGYIDNIAGTWSGEGRGTFASYPQTQAHVVSDNSTLVEDNFNDATYEGFRISSASSIGDDWDMLITHMSQDISADGVLFVPSLIVFLWMGIFGNAAIYQVINETSQLNEIVNNNYTVALFALFDVYPIATIVSMLALLIIVTFFVTSSDSGALVASMLSSKSHVGIHDESPILSRITWAILLGIVAAVLLYKGGLTALQTSVVICGVPFSLIVVFACRQFYKSLEDELED